MGTRHSTSVRSAILLAVFSLAAFAKPNLSGTWKLDPSKSEFGAMPGPSSMTRVITHNDPSMAVKTTQAGQRGEFTTELKYTTDGKESVNATMTVSLAMVRQIREYAQRTGFKVGYKPAGGIRTARQAMDYLLLMKEELGRDWLEPHLFRFGASSLLTDIERQLEMYVTGRYAAAHRHPMV